MLIALIIVALLIDWWPDNELKQNTHFDDYFHKQANNQIKGEK